MSDAPPPEERRRRRRRILFFWLWWLRLAPEARFYASALVVGGLLLLGTTAQALLRQAAFPLPASLPFSLPVSLPEARLPTLDDVALFVHPLLPPLPLDGTAVGAPMALARLPADPAPALPAAAASSSDGSSRRPDSAATTGEPSLGPAGSPASVPEPPPATDGGASAPATPAGGAPTSTTPADPPALPGNPVAQPTPTALPSPPQPSPSPIIPPAATPAATPAAEPTAVPVALVRLLAPSRTPLGPLFNATLVPGGEVVANVVVQNEGAVDLTYTLGAAPTTSSVLDADPASGLKLRVFRCSADFATCPDRLFSGPAATARAPLGGPHTVGRATRAAGLQPGARDYLQLRVRLPAAAGNAHKRSQSVLTLDWTATEAP